MKIRLCDKCNAGIDGSFIKCCQSSMENKQQKLEHVGDLCMTCWKDMVVRGSSLKDETK